MTLSTEDLWRAKLLGAITVLPARVRDDLPLDGIAD